MYGLIKTHKVVNPTRMITSGCSTAMEVLFRFVETALFSLVIDLEPRIRDMEHMANIVEELLWNLLSKSVIVGFDIVNIFPSIDNKFLLNTVFEILESRGNKFPPTQSVVEALELCLTCNNTIFNNDDYLQIDVTAQGLHVLLLSGISSIHFR